MPCRSTSWSRRSGATRRPRAATRHSRSRSRACARDSATTFPSAGAPPGTPWRSTARRSTAAASKRCAPPAELEPALALWRGPALADHRFENFAQAEIARLEDLRLETIEERLAAELAHGQSVDLIGELRALVAEHPLRERLRGSLMLALYRAGRQAEALEVMREGRQYLVEELGLEPGPELRKLESMILAHDARLDIEVKSDGLDAPLPRPCRRDDRPRGRAGRDRRPAPASRRSAC